MPKFLPRAALAASLWTMAVGSVLLASCGSGSGALTRLTGVAWQLTSTDSQNCGGSVIANTQTNSMVLAAGGPGLEYTSPAGCFFQFSVSGNTATLANGPVVCSTTLSNGSAVVFTWTTYTLAISANGSELTVQSTGTASLGGATCSETTTGTAQAASTPAPIPQPFDAGVDAGQAASPQIDLCWAQTPTTQRCLSQGPVTIPFGAIAFGGTAAPQEIDVINRSDVPLTVSAIALDAAATAAGFSIVEQVDTPVVLSAASGASLIMHVALTPKQSGSLAGSFQVTSNDPRLSGPASVVLSASGLPPGAPTACLGIYEIDYGNGQVAEAPQLDAAEPLSAQPSIVPPGTGDKAYFTAEPSPNCSDDPQDGQNMAYTFTLATPRGSAAALLQVSNYQQTVLFDVPGLYTVTLVAKDTAGLTATAQLPIQCGDAGAPDGG
jgi:hypothetical protein